MGNLVVFLRLFSPIFADYAIPLFLPRVDNPIRTSGKVWKQQILASWKPEEEEAEDGEEMGDAEMPCFCWCSAKRSHFPLREADQEASQWKPKDYILFVLGGLLR